MTGPAPVPGGAAAARALAAATARATTVDPALTTPDLPLPGDWSPRRLLLTMAGAHLLLLVAALRHDFVWGGGIAWLLDLGEAIALIGFTLTAGLAFARMVRQASSLDLRLVWRGGIALTALATLAPPFLSSDVWDYVARGFVAVLGENPYVTTVHQLKDQPAMTPFAAHAQWPTWVMPYGPISALLQWLCAALGAPWPAVYAWKALCALAHLAASALLLRTLRVTGSERDARRGLVLWLYNPWILLECCGSAHNEAFVALGLAALTLALARVRFAAAALAYGSVILVKHGAAPLSVFLLANAMWQRRRLAFCAGTALVLLAVLGCYEWLWAGPHGLDWIANQQQVANGSIAALLGRAFGDPARMLVMTVGLLALMVVLAASVTRIRDAQAMGRYGVLGMAVFTLFLVPNFAPWYHLWWLPLFALTSLPVLARVLELLAWTGPLSYLVYAGTRSFGVGHQVWALLLAGIWPVLLLLLEWRNLTGIQRPSTAADETQPDRPSQNRT